jgi:hypothetical protein
MHYKKYTVEELCKMTGADPLYVTMTWSANNRGISTVKGDIYQSKPIAFWKKLGVSHK